MSEKSSRQIVSPEDGYQSLKKINYPFSLVPVITCIPAFAQMAENTKLICRKNDPAPPVSIDHFKKTGRGGDAMAVHPVYSYFLSPSTSVPCS